MTMMAADSRNGAALAVGTVSGVQARLTALLDDHRGGAGWWVDIAGQLDRLSEALRRAPGDLVDPEGFTEQLRADAPHLMSRWVRLCHEGEVLAAKLGEVRLLVGTQAADPAAVPAVSTAIKDVLARARRYQERTTDVLLDAYERDIGGE